MPNYISDRLPSGSMDSFHSFREKAYPNMYFCKACKRAFDSIEAVEKCKFCESPSLQKMTSAREENPALKNMTNYRHYCPTCESSFSNPKKLNVCPKCKTAYIHVYKWGVMRKRDRIVHDLKNTLGLGKILQRVERAGKEKENKERPRKASWGRGGEEMPSY